MSSKDPAIENPESAYRRGYRDAVLTLFSNERTFLLPQATNIFIWAFSGALCDWATQEDVTKTPPPAIPKTSNWDASEYYTE